MCTISSKNFAYSISEKKCVILGGQNFHTIYSKSCSADKEKLIINKIHTFSVVVLWNNPYHKDKYRFWQTGQMKFKYKMELKGNSLRHSNRGVYL